MLAVLERAGARVAGEEAVAQHVREALSALERLPEQDLVSARRRELEALAEYLLRRRR